MYRYERLRTRYGSDPGLSAEQDTDGYRYTTHSIHDITMQLDSRSIEHELARKLAVIMSGETEAAFKSKVWNGVRWAFSYGTHTLL